MSLKPFIFIWGLFCVCVTCYCSPSLASQSVLLYDTNSQQVLLSEQDSAPQSTNTLNTSMATFVFLDLAKKRSIALSTPLNTQANALTLAQTLEACLVLREDQYIQMLNKFFQIKNEQLINLMNQKAKDLHLKESVFNSPFDGKTHKDKYTISQSSAKDVLKFYLALTHQYPETSQWLEKSELDLQGQKYPNPNLFLTTNKSIDGYFSSSDELGFSAAISAKNQQINHNRSIIAVVLGASDFKELKNEVSTLLLRGFRDFETIQLFKAGQVVGQAPIFKGSQDTVNLLTTQDIYITIDKERLLEQGSKAFDIQIARVSPLFAPLEKNSNIGEIIISIDNTPIKRTPIVTEEAVESSKFSKRVFDTLKLTVSPESSQNTSSQKPHDTESP